MMFLYNFIDHFPGSLQCLCSATTGAYCGGPGILYAHRLGPADVAPIAPALSVLSRIRDVRSLPALVAQGVPVVTREKI